MSVSETLEHAIACGIKYMVGSDGIFCPLKSNSISAE